MGPSSQFSTKVPQRSQHFYGFSMIVQIVFTAVGETKKPTRKSKVRETVCRANPNFSKSGWRQGLEPAINKRGPYKSAALSTTPAVWILAYFYTFLRLRSGFYIFSRYRLGTGLAPAQIFFSNEEALERCRSPAH